MITDLASWIIGALVAAIIADSIVMLHYTIVVLRGIWAHGTGVWKHIPPQLTRRYKICGWAWVGAFFLIVSVRQIAFKLGK